MLFLQPVRLAADRPHVWVSGADWSWDFLWPKAAAWSGFSVTTKSAWKQISTQVAPTARTCQWGMLDASGKTKPVKRVPLLCPSLVYSVHSFPLFFPFLSFSSRGQQVHSLSTPGEKQIPEEECNKALSLSLSLCLSFPLSFRVCVCSSREMGSPPIFAKQTCIHTHRVKADSANQSLGDTGCSDFGF